MSPSERGEGTKAIKSSENPILKAVLNIMGIGKCYEPNPGCVPNQVAVFQIWSSAAFTEHAEAFLNVWLAAFPNQVGHRLTEGDTASLTAW